jgi:hypothetical protein
MIAGLCRPVVSKYPSRSSILTFPVLVRKRNHITQRLSFATFVNEDYEDILPGTCFPQTSPEMPWKLDFMSERGFLSWYR